MSNRPNRGIYSTIMWSLNHKPCEIEGVKRVTKHKDSYSIGRGDILMQLNHSSKSMAKQEMNLQGLRSLNSTKRQQQQHATIQHAQKQHTNEIRLTMMFYEVLSNEVLSNILILQWELAKSKWTLPFAVFFFLLLLISSTFAMAAATEIIRKLQKVYKKLCRENAALCATSEESAKLRHDNAQLQQQLVIAKAKLAKQNRHL